MCSKGFGAAGWFRSHVADPKTITCVCFCGWSVSLPHARPAIRITANIAVAGVGPRCYGGPVPKNVLMCWRRHPEGCGAAPVVTADMS